MLNDSEDSEEIIERVSALDIGKAELVACVRVPNPDWSHRSSNSMVNARRPGQRQRVHGQDDLLFEIVHSVADLGMRNLRELAAVKADPAARLRSVVRGHVLYLIDHLTETTVLLHEIDQLSPERRGQIPTQEYASVLTGLIEDGQRAGVVKPDIDAHLATLAVLGAVNWVYRWYRSDGNRTPAEIADQYAETLVGCLLVAH